MKLKRISAVFFVLAATVILVAGSYALSPPASQAKRHEPPAGPSPGGDLISFDAMYGVDGPFVGAGYPIRNVPGDELPWAIAKSIKGDLGANGRLRIKVKGLVFKDDPSVPVDLRGKNDEATFRGLVSCLTEEGDHVGQSNVVTRGFPASEEGDSTIDERLILPNPCIAPIVMVLAGSEDKWFAVTGVETEGN